MGANDVGHISEASEDRHTRESAGQLVDELLVLLNLLQAVLGAFLTLFHGYLSHNKVESVYNMFNWNS